MFIYILTGTGSGTYVARERIIEIKPNVSRDGTETFTVRYDRGDGEVASGTGLDLDQMLATGRQRLPAPAGMTVGGLPVLWLEIETESIDGGCLAACFDASVTAVQLVHVPIFGEGERLGDDAADAAVAEAEEAGRCRVGAAV